MSERTERTVLNAIIVACRDAERGFTWAAEHAQDAKLRTMFGELASERHKFAEELLPHAQRLGGEAEGEGSRMASLHRAWMAIKDRMTTDHDHALLTEAARGEHSALAVYAEAVNGMLPPDAREIIEAQQKAVEAAWNRLHTLATVAVA